jgi:hypothetical protein
MGKKDRGGDRGGSPETSGRRERRESPIVLSKRWMFLLQPAFGFLSPVSALILPSTIKSLFLYLSPIPSPAPVGDSASGPDSSSWRERGFPV